MERIKTGKIADMRNKKFRFFKHTADVKFRAYGKTLEEAFENAGLAMFNAMYKGKVEKKTKRRIQVEGKDKESLLYNFLEELLFLLDTESFFLASCKAEIKDNSLEAELYGDNAKRYPVEIDVKAVTYNEMFIKQEKGVWVVQVVVDV